MSDREEILYLVDGSGFIFRAYYGIRAPMTAQDGTPTNAVFGFMRLLQVVLSARNPSHVAVVFDPAGGSFRLDLFPDYKANRKAPPDDLVPQFALCREATRALGLPALEVPRFEADDVIGTLAKRWTEGGGRCVIVTADKDLMQLVNERITLWDGKEKEIDIEGVKERFGVAPERVVDVLALAGDSSDNIPGVPGLGEKTGGQLIAQFGDLTTLLARAGEVKGKRGQSLVEFADSARLSYKLALIDTDVPISQSPAELKRRAANPDTLATFLRRLNFKQLLKDYGLERHATNPLDRSRYRTVLTEDALAEVVAQIQAAGRLSLDLETTSLNPLDAEVVGFALAWGPGQAAYVPVAHAYADAPAQLSRARVVEVLRPFIEDPAFPKVGQNVKYEWSVLTQSLGLNYQGVVGDSMLAAYLLDPNRNQFNLDELAADYLSHRMISFAEATNTTGKATAAARFAEVAVEKATSYAAEDADVALRLCDLLLPKLEAEGLTRLNTEVELPLTRVLGKMELAGVKIDPALLAAQAAGFATQIAALEEDIYALADERFNLDSPKQLGSILFEKLGLPAEKKLKTGYSTNQEVLEGLAPLHPLPAKLLTYRHLTKLKGTYLDTLPTLIHPKTGRVHSSFKQAVTATGRISSADPNLQNIPVRTPEGRAIREAFIAEPGHVLISADYSQIELRLLAHYSEDPGLIEAFATDADIHTRTASEMFGLPLLDEVSAELRRKAKAINFGLMYGMGPFRLAADLGIPQREAKALIDRYFERYRGVKRYFDEAIADARKTKKARTLLGRVRPLADLDTQRFSARQAAERLAINTPIQGTAADLLKLAMLKVDEALTQAALKTRMVLTVHDELVLEAPEAEAEAAAALVKHAMESAMEGVVALKVPLKVEVGTGLSWAAIH